VSPRASRGSLRGGRYEDKRPDPDSKTRRLPGVPPADPPITWCIMDTASPAIRRFLAGWVKEETIGAPAAIATPSPSTGPPRMRSRAAVTPEGCSGDQGRPNLETGEQLKFGLEGRGAPRNAGGPRLGREIALAWRPGGAAVAVNYKARASAIGPWSKRSDPRRRAAVP